MENELADVLPLEGVLLVLQISAQITRSNETIISGRVKRAMIGQDILLTKDEITLPLNLTYGIIRWFDVKHNSASLL